MICRISTVNRTQPFLIPVRDSKISSRMNAMSNPRKSISGDTIRRCLAADKLTCRIFIVMSKFLLPPVLFIEKKPNPL
jgi:hypothetical protein